MKMQMGPSDHDLPQPELNITPLVDVMLVLLIIFMVAAPMMDQGITLDLPQTKGASIPTTPEKQMVLHVKKDRSLYLGQKQFGLEELKQKLQIEIKSRKDKTLFVRADKSVPYGYVAFILAEVRALGLNRLGLVTVPLDGSE